MMGVRYATVPVLLLVRWSDLVRQDPARLEIDLARIGITVDDLLSDAEDVPELRPILARLTSKEARLRTALEWFGDQGHPQPQDRDYLWTFHFGGETVAIPGRTPDWPGGRLPPLEDDEAHDLPGDPVEERPATERRHEPSGTLVVTSLAEKAVQLHADEKLGRRKLDTAIPGLGQWAAGRVIWWHDSVGRPAGLWLEVDRLRWGPAITPVWDEKQDRYERDGVTPTTPRWLRLPAP